jgi:predicted nuclease of predicted toxin-antitoxin system
MRILLDECLPRQLGRDLVGHSVRTVTQVGWSGVENGELLGMAAKEFEVFITIDRRLTENHVPPPSLAIVALKAVNNRVETLRPLVPEVLRVLTTIRPGQVVRVGV